MLLNPTVKIISLITTAIILQHMQGVPLAIFSVLMLVAVRLIQAADFFVLLRRARWLLLSIAVIYAYATPGEFLPQIPDVMAPTYEGLREGATQTLRLALMLAMLALLLATSSRAQIMSGIYQLLKPFQFIGVQPERFAARLWLTLHYVEHMPPGTLKKLREEKWNVAALEFLDEGPARVTLEFSRWGWPDFLVLALLPVLWWVTR